MRGIEGYGASSRIHTSRLLSLSEDLPVAVVIVDAKERIDAYLPELDELITEGLVIVDPVDVIKYVGRP
jgi:PII-like signaling protein